MRNLRKTITTVSTFASVLILSGCSGSAAAAQPDDYETRIYKIVDGDSLVMHIFTPGSPGTIRSAVVLFHGGGFVWGGPEITDGSAREYAAKGLVAFSVEYRLAERKKITPLDQLEDAYDAIRWVRAHAGEYHVDPKRVIAHGVSAGGYLAAMAANSSDYGVRPDALVLWSPGVGGGDDPYFRSLLLGRADARDLSPLARIPTPPAPAIIISGALDSVTYETEARIYCARLVASGGRCVLHSYPNLGHTLTRRLDAESQLRGRYDWDAAAVADASERVWAFLRSLGLLGID